MAMMTVPELAAETLGEFLANYMRRRFGSSQAHLVEMVPSIARIAIECIGNSDALFHNVEHTMLVTLAGHDIMRGRALRTHMLAEDYAHVIIACLIHDIGYVRGLFRDDDEDGYVVDESGRKVTLPRGSSDAALLPYHVDRSKMFAMERIEGMAHLDKHRIARAIEGTRFPSIIPGEDEEVDELHASRGNLWIRAALLGPPQLQHHARVVRNPGAPCHLAQGKCRRTDLGDQPDSRAQQRLP